VIDWPIEQPTIYGDVISLRPLRESDIEAIYNACQDPTISAFTRVPYPYDFEMAVEFVRESAIAYRNHISATFAIEVGGKFAGTIGLHSLQLGDHMAEIGYWIESSYRGDGICTAALKLLTDFALEAMKFRRIEGLTDFDNAASQKVLERAGYQREALLASRVTKPDGNQIDMILFAKVASS
jgi:RimJ/RimL family protein N-acetyltransferase